MVFVDYLRHLAGNPDNLFTLAIGVSMNELEVYAKNVPSQISMAHMVEANLLTR